MGLSGISPLSLLLILLIILLLFGAKRLPSIAKDIGTALKHFKASAQEKSQDNDKEI